MNLQENISRIKSIMGVISKSEPHTILTEDRYKGYKRFLKDNVLIGFNDYVINDMFRETNDLGYEEVKGKSKDEIIDYFLNGDGKKFLERYKGFEGQKPKVIEIKWDDLVEPLKNFLKNKMSGENSNFNDSGDKINKIKQREPKLGNGNNEPILIQYNDKGQIENIMGGNHRTYAAFQLNNFNPIMMKAYVSNNQPSDLNELDPKTGTGKKPKGSDRRLYTDENPSDTVSVKFKTKEDIVDTLNKDSFKSKPHKRQSQIINLIHQRVRAAYQNASDPEVKKRLKRGLDYIENEKEKSKEKTVELQKGEMKEEELTEKCWSGYTQKGMKTMFGKEYPNCVKKKKKKK